jgi:hypothetical protein
VEGALVWTQVDQLAVGVTAPIPTCLHFRQTSDISFGVATATATRRKRLFGLSIERFSSTIEPYRARLHSLQPEPPVIVII